MSGHSKWANIKIRKGKQDASRGKIFTKIGREIMVAVRSGGADPSGNMRLKLALQKARQANMPAENIKRAVEKGAGTGDNTSIEELVYEGYGPNGAAVMIEVVTDNRNRTAGEIRHLFTKCNGNMGESGCVGWMFTRKGIIILDGEEQVLDEEAVMEVALEAGADDLEITDEQVEISTSPEALDGVREALEAKGYKTSVAEITMDPQTRVQLEGKDASNMRRLVDTLDDHDDVQAVYHNWDEPEEEDEE